MAYPSVERIELPLLQELVATGGVEHARFLYDRLVAYFPQLGGDEVRAAVNGHRRQWRRLVQGAPPAPAGRRDGTPTRGARARPARRAGPRRPPRNRPRPRTLEDN